MMEIGHTLKYMSAATHLIYDLCEQAVHSHTYLCNSLKAHIVSLVLALPQFLQSHSHLSDEFISSQSVHVTYTQPSHTCIHTHTHRRTKGEKQVSHRKGTCALLLLHSAHYQKAIIDCSIYSASEQSISSCICNTRPVCQRLFQQAFKNT